ncbi:winged helix-turn-helix transcriptional regulator [Pseudochrobactrum algeriensis]|uniref:MarR family winged helix-turn-helix transcriptional regulator n=1 Tax=Pseudochrobactrum algeriensis TaxID=2834768 RepID=UPI001BCFEC51|nr:MarR family winged helix-turn-helix transcriptional regulator [Pseudochrobactrum algeriensis]MBX8812146.1 winged helix-turn-helix transcriptional regulator [Ochrobactrum sp. MR34]QVQ37333.1 winged helix-turn-helix transcriptional regulator [Pseudochrobactrum algeriensis]QVQ40552.1 winged helix-turn-helix transcriptional regulator [Pseudochrobactrum algeriensis]QVQ44474.1 winged helix-turn-helix transcriptional regulator [Pseudochrobactrum algeriensis]
MSINNVQNTHTSAMMRDLHGSLIEIVSAMNRPQRDDELVREAGISLDRALFRLLVAVERMGPIGVVELAERVGLDYTTVSRQVAKLDGLGLVARRGSTADRRVREAITTPEGKLMTDKIDAARERMSRAIFDKWDEKDIADLVRLMRRFANAFKQDRNDVPKAG